MIANYGIKTMKPSICMTNYADINLKKKDHEPKIVQKTSASKQKGSLLFLLNKPLYEICRLCFSAVKNADPLFVLTKAISHIGNKSITLYFSTVQIGARKCHKELAGTIGLCPKLMQENMLLFKNVNIKDLKNECPLGLSPLRPVWKSEHHSSAR